jgi:hypothetical protein
MAAKTAKYATKPRNTIISTLNIIFLDMNKLEDLKKFLVPKKKKGV